MVTVAGVGPGNPKYLTVEVKEAIEEAKCILAFGRISNSLSNIRNDFIQVNKVEDIIQYTNIHENLLLLASGDPNFYGVVEFLKKKGVLIKKVLPGLSSFQYMMAKLEKSWQEAKFLSLHGRDESLEIIKGNSFVVMLTDRENNPSKISKKLASLGVKGTMYVGFNLSYEDEEIIKINIGEEVENISTLAVVVIENEVD